MMGAAMALPLLGKAVEMLMLAGQAANVVGKLVATVVVVVVVAVVAAAS
jgi:hypothetical protein